ncbi:MAG: hypothetical protein WCQ75_04350, partial [Bacilli bacterium]
MLKKLLGVLMCLLISTPLSQTIMPNDYEDDFVIQESGNNISLINNVNFYPYKIVDSLISNRGYNRFIIYEFNEFMEVEKSRVIDLKDFSYLPILNSSNSLYLEDGKIITLILYYDDNYDYKISIIKV